MTFEEKFWSRTRPDGDCIIWTMSKTQQGYGRTCRNGKVEKTHKIAWELCNGPIPNGSWVLHRCDNPPCVNPDHLFLGNSKMNSIDMVRKGRCFYSKKGFCAKGHEYSEKNTMKLKGRFGEKTHRQCRICQNAAKRKWRYDKKQRLALTDPSILLHHNTRKRFCPHGHEYTEENTYRNKRNSRVCRTCKRLRYHGVL